MDNSWTSNELLFSFEGRINRAKYWYALYAGMISFPLCLVVLALALSAIFGVSIKSVHLNIYDAFNDPPSFPFRVSFGSSVPAWLAFLLFYAGGTPIVVGAIRFLAATTVKRLHDRNRSGWWAVAVLIVNRLSYVYYGLFFGLYFGVDVSGARELALVMFAVALSVLQTWIVIELFFLTGTDGTNRFGADPTRTLTTSPPALRTEQFGVPDFLLHRAGPRPT